MADEDALPPVPGLGIPLLCYMATLLGALYVAATWRPEGLWLALTIAPPVAALGWMIQRGIARRRAGGGRSTPAQRAYVRRFVPLMIAYVLILGAAIWLKHNAELSRPMLAVLAVLSALPLVGVVWAMGRMLADEKDEYQRLLLVRQVVVATGFALAVTSVWGFLDDFGLVPHAPMYWAFIIWCAGLGIGTLWNELKA